MKQYTYEEVLNLTFRELGAIVDPLQLAATQHVSPMLVRYVIRTDQLEVRYPGVRLRTLLGAIEVAAKKVKWPDVVGQNAPLAIVDTAVDAYLDELQPYVAKAIELAPKYH